MTNVIEILDTFRPGTMDMRKVVPLFDRGKPFLTRDAETTYPLKQSAIEIVKDEYSALKGEYLPRFAALLWLLDCTLTNARDTEKEAHWQHKYTELWAFVKKEFNVTDNELTALVMGDEFAD